MKKVQLWTAVVFGAAAALLIAGACALGQTGSISLELDSVMQARAADAARMVQRQAPGPAHETPASTSEDRTHGAGDDEAFHAWTGHVLIALVTVFWIVVSVHVISRLTRRPLDEIRQGLDCAPTDLHPVTHLDERLREAVGGHGAGLPPNAVPGALPDAPAAHAALVQATQLDPERIEHIAAEMRGSIARVVSLQMQTANVDTIVKTVNEVAEQMHLLALNAAIDAAEGGTGAERDFAVAAGKVAKETRRSAREIGAALASRRPGAGAASTAA